jgi:hypothetical protein
LAAIECGDHCPADCVRQCVSLLLTRVVSRGHEFALRLA